MYFRSLDSIPDHARVPPKFSLVFQRQGENSSPARRPLAYLGTVFRA